MGEVTMPSELCRKKYIERNAFICGGKTAYSDVILPSLLLGCRVRDYEQRCATVMKLGDMMLNMPAQGGRIESLNLKTASGQRFSVDVKSVEKEETERRWFVTCHESSLPSEVRQGCQLEIVKGAAKQSPVTTALYQFYSNKKAAAAKTVENNALLKCLYSTPSHRVYPAVDIVDPSIRLNKGGVVLLNQEQAEAVARYNSDGVPAFVIEAPPGSGKTLTAAAMAVGYKGKGVQLFLSTANVPVMNMALALNKLNYGRKSPIHLASSEYEEKLLEDDYSPFSSLALAKNQNLLQKRIHQLERHMPAGFDEKKRQALIDDTRRATGAILNERHDIYFATVDSILNRLFKHNKGGNHREDDVKALLENEVKRVVVDEASQLTESALNALILAFPKAQIVLIGDQKQLAPYRYVKGDVVSELAARSALDVAKDKKNLPVIKLRKVYRAEQSLIGHYSDVFYGGALVSFKPPSDYNPLSCFLGRGGGSRCLFWKVKNGYCNQEGTSKKNFREVNALNHIIQTLLRYGNVDKKDVMIISYYEAQRKAAEARLPKGFEVLTVDSAQGREKKIVIVLTTRTSVPSDPNEDFFNSAKRCNVAVSRHQEALIVIGHPSVASAPNWTDVLSSTYFHHVEDDSGSRPGFA